MNSLQNFSEIKTISLSTYQWLLLGGFVILVSLKTFLGGCQFFISMTGKFFKIFHSFDAKLKNNLPDTRKRSFIVLGTVFLIGLGCTLTSSVALNEIGHFLLAAIIVHFLFDFFVNKTHEKELAELIVGRRNSALIDIHSFFIPTETSPSPDDQYRQLISTAVKTSANLEVCANYKCAIFQYFKDEFKSRTKNNKLKTKLFLLDTESKAAKYINEETSEFGDEEAVQVLKAARDAIIPTLAQIFIDFKLKPINHKKVLRYEFMRSDQYIWFSPYLNSNSNTKPAWIVIPEHSPLFEKYNDDINRFINSLDERSDEYVK